MQSGSALIFVCNHMERKPKKGSFKTGDKTIDKLVDTLDEERLRNCHFLCLNGKQSEGNGWESVSCPGSRKRRANGVLLQVLVDDAMVDSSRRSYIPTENVEPQEGGGGRGWAGRGMTRGEVRDAKISQRNEKKPNL